MLCCALLQADKGAPVLMQQKARLEIKHTCSRNSLTEGQRQPTMHTHWCMCIILLTMHQFMGRCNTRSLVGGPTEGPSVPSNRMVKVSVSDGTAPILSGGVPDNVRGPLDADSYKVAWEESRASGGPWSRGAELTPYKNE